MGVFFCLNCLGVMIDTKEISCGRETSRLSKVLGQGYRKRKRGGGVGDTLPTVASQEWYGTDLCCWLIAVKTFL
jgi:hypothetical protein